MVTIVVNKETITYDREQLISSIVTFVYNMASAAQQLCGRHIYVRGGPDISGVNRKMIWGILGEEVALAFLDAIDDQPLRQVFEEYIGILRRLINHDDRMRSWLANYLGGVDSDFKIRHSVLRRRFASEMQRLNNFEGPVSWVREPEYQTLMQGSIDILIALQGALLQLETQARKLIPDFDRAALHVTVSSDNLVPAEWSSGNYMQDIRNWPLLTPGYRSRGSTNVTQ